MGIHTARQVVDESRRINKILGTISFADATLTLSKSLSSLRPPSGLVFDETSKPSLAQVHDEAAERAILRNSLSSMALRKIKKKPVGKILQEPTEPAVLPRVKSNNTNILNETDYDRFGKLSLQD